jgi:excisionase family DNA binding protein
MNQLLTAKEVAKLLKVSLPLIYRMAERRQIPAVRWQCPGNGRAKSLLRFKIDDVLTFIESNYQQAR